MKPASADAGLVRMFDTSIPCIDSRLSTLKECEELYIPQRSAGELQSVKSAIMQDFERQWEETQEQLLQYKRGKCRRQSEKAKPAEAELVVRMNDTSFPKLLVPEECERTSMQDFKRQREEAQEQLLKNEKRSCRRHSEKSTPAEEELVRMNETSLQHIDPRLLVLEECEEFYVSQNSEEELQSVESAFIQDFERQHEEAQELLLQNKNRRCKRQSVKLSSADAGLVRMHDTSLQHIDPRLLVHEECEEFYTPQNSEEELQSIKSSIVQAFERGWEEAHEEFLQNERRADLDSTELNCTNQNCVSDADISCNYQCFYDTDMVMFWEADFNSVWAR